MHPSYSFLWSLSSSCASYSTGMSVAVVVITTTAWREEKKEHIYDWINWSLCFICLSSPNHMSLCLSKWNMHGSLRSFYCVWKYFNVFLPGSLWNAGQPRPKPTSQWKWWHQQNSRTGRWLPRTVPLTEQTHIYTYVKINT